ncbi:unnamed protein product [Calypogeia fissa]
MVREMEEVLGSSTNWSKHVYKQFHHEMVGSRVHKKSILGSHICMIFAWYKQERCKDHVDPLPSTIPPPSVSVRIRPTIVKPREPAQVQAPAAVANGHSGGEVAPILEAPVDIEMVEVLPRSSRRAHAQRVESSGSDME